MKKIYETLDAINKTGWVPNIKVIQGVSSDPEVTIDGKKVLLLCSANYLGLANDREVKNAMIEGIEQYGLHPTGSRLISGTQDIHLKLEKEVADFKKQESAMLFTTGTMANIGTIPALMNLPLVSILSYLKLKFFSNGSHIFSDKLNHATIIDGCKLSKGKTHVYKHIDMGDLEDKLKKVGKNDRKLIVSDGVFSMDGDIAPLPKLIELAKKYDAMLMIDDAHGTGVIGEKGGGISEYFNISEGIDIHMGTFSKSFGLLGGFIAGNKKLIDYLKISARTYIFSGALWGSISFAVLKSFEILKKDKERLNKLKKNSNYFRDGLKRIGYKVIDGDTPIIPIFIGDEIKAIKISEELLNRGILAPSVRYPAVDKGESRIRFSIISTLTREQLDKTLNTLEIIKNH